MPTRLLLRSRTLPCTVGRTSCPHGLPGTPNDGRPRVKLVVYGDFNCPYSCLASARADTLLAQGVAEIDCGGGVRRSAAQRGSSAPSEICSPRSGSMDATSGTRQWSASWADTSGRTQASVFRHGMTSGGAGPPSRADARAPRRLRVVGAGGAGTPRRSGALILPGCSGRTSARRTSARPRMERTLAAGHERLSWKRVPPHPVAELLL